MRASDPMFTFFVQLGKEASQNSEEIHSSSLPVSSVLGKRYLVTFPGSHWMSVTMFLSSHLFHLVKVCCGMSDSVETSNAQLFARRAGSLRPDMCAEVSTGNGFPQSHMLIIYPGTEGGSLCNPWSLLLVRLSLVERGNIYAFEDEVTVSWRMQKEVSQAFMWNVVLMNEQSFRRGSCDCELVRSGRVWWWMQDFGLTWWWGLDGWKEWGCHLRETAVNHPEVRP